MRQTNISASRPRASFKKVLCGASALATVASLASLTPVLTPAASAARVPAAYSTNTTSYCKAGATPITFWGWVPGMYRMVDVFNQTHPSICVDFVTKVGGSGEYVPLLNALKANSGPLTLRRSSSTSCPSSRSFTT